MPNGHRIGYVRVPDQLILDWLRLEGGRIHSVQAEDWGIMLGIEHPDFRDLVEMEQIPEYQIAVRTVAYYRLSPRPGLRYLVSHPRQCRLWLTDKLMGLVARIGGIPRA